VTRLMTFSSRSKGGLQGRASPYRRARRALNRRFLAFPLCSGKVVKWFTRETFISDVTLYQHLVEHNIRICYGLFARTAYKTNNRTYNNKEKRAYKTEEILERTNYNLFYVTDQTTHRIRKPPKNQFAFTNKVYSLIYPVDYLIDWFGDPTKHAHVLYTVDTFLRFHEFFDFIHHFVN
jgi:hypothetical protein